MKAGDLDGPPGSTLLLRDVPGIAAERVLLVSLGEHSKYGEQGVPPGCRKHQQGSRRRRGT